MIGHKRSGLIEYPDEAKGWKHSRLESKQKGREGRYLCKAGKESAVVYTYGYI